MLVTKKFPVAQSQTENAEREMTKLDRFGPNWKGLHIIKTVTVEFVLSPD